MLRDALLAPPEDLAMTATGCRLSRLLGRIDRVSGDTAGTDPLVRRVRHDSRTVEAGDLFVAVSGARDGAEFAADAVARGAVAVVAESADRRVGVPWIRVPDARAALARLADEACGRPSERLRVTGVTGTNGKTTTARALASILRAAGRPTGVVGTLGCSWPGHETGARLTTPEAPDLQGMLADMLEAGCRDAVVEVSSHAVSQDRVAALRFATLGFTNLSHDHLDWHGDLESYYLSKLRLFEELAPEAPLAACTDDAHGRRLVSELTSVAPRRRVIRCGHDEGADLRIARRASHAEGTTLTLAGRPELGLPERLEVRWPLPGRHNATNAALAAALAVLRGVPHEAIAEGLAGMPALAGRFEVVAGRRGGGPLVVVDFAHAPAALEEALLAAREIAAGGRVACVFGCGGDRDREKRAPMGEIVGRLADLAIVTSDNPRSEDPQAIVDQTCEGLREARAEVVVELDRRRAIGLALDWAREGDLLLVAGKGHETRQEIGGRRLEFDDRVVARELWRERHGGAS